MEKKDLLKEEIQHFDIKKVDATEIINSMRGMSFTSRDTATAADIYDRMINDKDCSIILTLAGSTSAETSRHSSHRLQLAWQQEQRQQELELQQAWQPDERLVSEQEPP